MLVTSLIRSIRHTYTLYHQPLNMGESLPPREGERIPRRTPPNFDELSDDVGVIEGIFSGGIINVAINDTNQYGPHAMIAMLGVVATITGLALLALWII